MMTYRINQSPYKLQLRNGYDTVRVAWESVKAKFTLCISKT